MTPNAPQPDPAKKIDKRWLAVARASRRSRLVCAESPHLAGLVHLVRVKATRYYAVAAVGPSGVVGVNPDVFARLPLVDAAYVLAHELLHLALDTHGRQGRADPYLVNVAHDYVINDMLCADMGRGVPLGGLTMPGAREKSLEGLIVDLSKGGKGGRRPVWGGGGRRHHRRPKPGKNPMRQALEDAGLVPPEEQPPPDEPELGGRSPLGDLMPSNHESALEPEVSPQQRRATPLRDSPQGRAKAFGLGQLRAKLDRATDQAAAGVAPDPERGERLMKALHTAYPAALAAGPAALDGRGGPGRPHLCPRFAPRGRARRRRGAVRPLPRGLEPAHRPRHQRFDGWMPCRRCWAPSPRSATAPASARFTSFSATSK